jgi:PAS domain S-box-containing protein
MLEEDPGKYGILHVDDNYDALLLLKMKLKGDFNITSARGADEALQVMESQDFDAVVTDFEMPGMNGLEFLKIIKERNPQTPVIFYTGQGNEEVAREAFMNGVSDYLTKSRQEIAHTEKLKNSILKAVNARRSGEELKETHRRFSTLIQNVPGMVYRCKNDPDWTMEFLNENTYELTGYTPDEIIGNSEISYSQIIHPEDREDVWKGVQKAIENQRPFDLEYRIITRTGVIKNVLEKGLGVFDSQGSLLALEGVIIDDTKRKIAEQSMIQSNQVLMAVRDINRLIVREKKPGVLLGRACEILVKYRGYRLAWVGMLEEGTPFLLPIAWFGEELRFLEMMQSNCKGIDECPMGRAIFSGKPYVSRNIAQDPSGTPCREEALRMGFRSGAFLPLKFKSRIFGAMVVFSDSPYVFDLAEIDLLEELADDISLALSAIEDETGRIRAEEALKASETRYRALFEQAYDAVYIEDTEGRILDANPRACEMLNFTREELIKKKVMDLVPKDVANRFPAIVHALKDGKSFYLESQNISREGRVVDVEASISPLYLEDKMRVLVIVRDVTEKKKNQAEMEWLKNRFQTVVENAPLVAIQGYDAEGRIIHWNRESERLFGIKTEEALGKNVKDLIFDDESRAFFEKKLARVIESGLPSPASEVILTGAGGRKLHFLSTIFPVFEKDRLAEIFSIRVDITSVKEAQAAMKISEERYRGIFEYMSSGASICSITGDPADAVFTEWNHEAEEIFGIKKSSIIGRKVLQVFPGAREIGIIDAIGQVWQTGTPLFLEPKLYKDSVYEQWIEYIIYKNASSGEVVMIFDDVTERIEAEIALKESRDRLSGLIECQRDVIFETDKKGIFTFVSPASLQVLGLEPEKILGRHFTQLIAEGCREQFESFLKSHGKKNKTEYHSLECECIYADGSNRQVMLNIQLLYNRSGKMKGSRGAIRDVTETRMAALELKKSEEKYRLLVESSTDAIFVVDTDFRFISVNQEAARSFKKSPEEMIGLCLDQVFPPEIANRQMDSIGRVIKTAQPFLNIENVSVTAEGVRWYNTNLIPLNDEKGRVTRVMGVARDVTGVREMSVELKKSEEKYRTLVESSIDPIFVIDRDCRFVSLNRKAASDMGTDESEIAGKSMFEIFPAPIAKSQAENVRKVIESGKPLISIEEQSRTVEGDKWYNTNLIPLKDDKGEVTRVMGVARDVTRVKEIASELQQAQEKFRLLMESATDAIYFVDEEYRLISVNRKAAQISGITREEMIGRRISDIFPPERANEYQRLARSVFASGEPVLSYTSENEQPPGQKQFNTTVLPLKDEKGKTVMLLGISRDITDTVKTREVLAQTRRMNREIIETAPLGIVIMNASNGNISMMNREAQKITGYTMKELPDMMTWFEKAFPDPQYRQKLFCEWMEDTGDEDFKGSRELEVMSGEGTVKSIRMFCQRLMSGSIIAFLLEPDTFSSSSRPADEKEK